MGRGPESPIQAQIVRTLPKLFDCRCAANNNGGYRTRTEAFELKDTGTWAGYPDVSIFGRRAAMFFIETKAKIQVRERAISPFERFHSLSASQKVAVPELRERGFRVAVVDNVEEAVACANAFGLGLRISAPLRPRVETGF
jgi:hypothetical protein